MLVTIAERPDLSTSPLSMALDDLPAGWRLWVLALDSEGSAPSGAFHTRLEDLGLPTAALRFALEPYEVAVVAKPRFLRHVLRSEPDAEVLFIDAGCLVGLFPKLSHLAPDALLEVFPLLPTHLASLRPSTDATYESLGNPTGDLLRFRSSPEVAGALDRWQAWMEAAYVAQPVGAVSELEKTFLRTLPAAHSWARWNHDQVYALWADLRPEAPVPPVVGTVGLGRVVADGLPGWPRAGRLGPGSPIWDLAERSGSLPERSSPTYRSGRTSSRLARTIFRAVDPWGERWPDPTEDGAGGFRPWLEEEDGRGLPRLAQALYWSRSDLRTSFPARSSTVAGFAHWLRKEGIGPTEQADPPPSVGVTRRAARAVRRRIRRMAGTGEPTLASPRPPPNAAAAGINVVGFAKAESGLGEAMRATLAAVDSLNIPRATVDLSSRLPVRQMADVNIDAVGCPYEVTIFHLNPDTLLGYLDDGPLSYRMTASWAIGYFFWETDQIPREWLAALDLVDEVWVGSRFLQEAFRRETRKPVTVMGLPVEPPSEIHPDRERFGIAPDEFVVAFVADAFSGVERKNPTGLAEAFARAFGPDYQGVRLLIKMSNLDQFHLLQEELDRLSEEMPLTVLEDYLDRTELWRLLASTDVYASLHRSEGLGLTILEAMAAGVPVVATNYGGNTDFTTEENSLLVDYDVLPAEGNIYAGHTWAQPNLDQAANHLRLLRADEELRYAIGSRGRATVVSSQYSPRTYAGRVSARLHQLGLSWASPRA